MTAARQRGARQAKRVTREQRAFKYELLYRALGERRSVRLVFEFARDAGDTIANSTLEQYAADYRWVANAEQWDAEQRQRLAVERLDSAIAEDIAQSRLFRNLRHVAETGLGPYLEPHAKIDMTPVEIARLAEIAVKGERLISGKATERVEVMTSIMLLIQQQISPSAGRAFDLIEEACASDDVERVRGAIAQARLDFANETDRAIETEFRSYGIGVDLIEGEDE